ncbi:MAG: response regulator [Nitrospirae bacterium]|nr:response regulator [Nitrospirota bacterium]
MKTLIVDDNPDDRLMLKTNLEAHNCEVIEAADGMEGLELAKKHKPTLIISDALMPRMDGFQFLRKVRQDMELKAIPFVFYSSTYTGEKEVELAISLGADAYIFKPKEPVEFWAEILKILDACALKKDRQRKETILQEDEYLRIYNDVVTTKLEEKIKELEKAKDCAEESRRQYEKLFDASLDGIYSTDENNRFVQTNSAFARIFGYDRPDELLGRSALDFWADKEARNRYLETLQKKRGVSSYPVHARKRNGAELFLEISSNIVENDDGRFMGIEGIVRDVTGREKLEEQLRHAQRLEGIGQLAGGVAHDFNNVLNAVVGYAGLLQMRLDKFDPLRHFADEISAAGMRGAALTQQILAFGRRQVLDMKPANLNDIVKGLDKMLHRLIREDISLDMKLFDKDLVVLADASQLGQVLINLVTNARDAIAQVGSIRISTELFVMDEEYIAMYGYGETGEYALLTVSDTGCGIDTETKEHIFEPFYTTKEVGKGTGLGLAVVHGIVKQHSGYVSVDSEAGQGTTFKIYLPLTEHAAEKIEAGSSAPISGGTETVLLAEDDPSLRKLSAIMLRDFGYSVIEAVDGEDAVRKFADYNDEIKLVILDGIMPKKRGKEAYEDIILIKPEIRVIFVSGYSEDIMGGQSLKEKGLLYLSKPVTPSVLLRAVREVLDK